ncbi:MAG: TFIIB-type zinc ribbon-containing protein, partial [Halovenus sp.]
MSETNTASSDGGNGERTRQRPGESTSEDESEDENTLETQAGEQLVCPECGGNLVEDAEHGETVCQDCGLVVEEDSVDRGPEWRAFNSQDREEKSRVGAPTTNMMHDKGLSTNIGWQDK